MRRGLLAIAVLVVVAVGYFALPDADVAYAHEVHAQLHVWPGVHESSYRLARMSAYLKFYADTCS